MTARSAGQIESAGGAVRNCAIRIRYAGIGFRGSVRKSR